MVVHTITYNSYKFAALLKTVMSSLHARILDAVVLLEAQKAGGSLEPK